MQLFSAGVNLSFQRARRFLCVASTTLKQNCSTVMSGKRGIGVLYSSYSLRVSRRHLRSDMPWRTCVVVKAVVCWSPVRDTWVGALTWFEASACFWLLLQIRVAICSSAVIFFFLARLLARLLAFALLVAFLQKLFWLFWLSWLSWLACCFARLFAVWAFGCKLYTLSTFQALTFLWIVVIFVFVQELLRLGWAIARLTRPTRPWTVFCTFWSFGSFGTFRTFRTLWRSAACGTVTACVQTWHGV